MKGFGIAALGLALLTVGASADEIQTPVQTLKLTIGNVVTTLQLPASVVDGTKRNWVKVLSTTVRRETNSTTFTGDATFSSSFGLKMSADEIKLNERGEDRSASFSLNGKVVIEVQEDGKEAMRIIADKAVLEQQ